MGDALLQKQYCHKAKSFSEESESLWLFVESIVSSFDKRIHTMEYARSHSYVSNKHQLPLQTLLLVLKEGVE